MARELNIPIPTKNEKILQMSYYPEIPQEYTIFTNISTYHMVSSATEASFGQLYNY